MVKEEDKKMSKKDEIKELNEKIKELENEVLKAKADLINYRKRKDDEVREYLKYATSDLVYELLGVLDNFERAINLDDNNLSDELSNFLTGFKMIYVSFKDVLEKEGLKEIDALGLEFDAKYHDCLFTDCDKEKLDNVVLDVLLKGYMFKDKVLRCSSVKVNKLDNINEENEEENKNE